MEKIKVLVVEDEFLIAKDISLILNKDGYKSTIGIADVEEAIAILDNENFDLVLIDIQLRNGSNGIDLGEYLLIKDKIPFIYITSNSDTTTLSRVKDTRPYGIIIKPYKPIDILTTTSIVLNNFKHNKIDTLRSIEMKIDETPFILKGVVKYVNDNISNRIDINELSKMTSWSSQHFIRVFSQFMGDTPYQFILKKKMEKAEVLISETDISMKDIAFELGFQSYGNFCKIFKREKGKKPDEYRKLEKIKKYIN